LHECADAKFLTGWSKPALKGGGGKKRTENCCNHLFVVPLEVVPRERSSRENQKKTTKQEEEKEKGYYIPAHFEAQKAWGGAASLYEQTSAECKIRKRQLRRTVFGDRSLREKTSRKDLSTKKEIKSIGKSGIGEGGEKRTSANPNVTPERYSGEDMVGRILRLGRRLHNYTKPEWGGGGTKWDLLSQKDREGVPAKM